MFVITGASGHVGSVAAEALLAAGQQVRVVVRDAAKAEALKARGAEVVVADLADAAAFARAVRGAQGVFLLSPPDLGAKNFIGDRKRQTQQQVDALAAEKVSHVVLLSSTGSQHASGTGPIVTTHNAEQQLRASGLAATFVRAAYFVENWGAVVPAVRSDGLSRQLVAAAARAGQRGADLTGKLLAFARRLALEPTAVDPVAMLHSLADMLRRTLGENIRITVQAPPGAPRCLADAVQLESALLNVAVNARDAMPDGGTLLLRCGTGTPSDSEGPETAPGGLDGDTGDAPHGWVWFSVQDNGCGMSEHVRDRAFEPFFTTKDAGRGTGLGLSTVYGFIKQSRGHLALDSAPGAGTTVTMFLPALAGDDAAADGIEAAQAASVPRGLRVLLVEDDLEVRRVAQAFLESMACEVVACTSGEAALTALDGAAEGRGFDLLFSDIMLGAGIDGRELAQRIGATHPALAVLLTSGYSSHLAQGSTNLVLPANISDVGSMIALAMNVFNQQSAKGVPAKS